MSKFTETTPFTAYWRLHRHFLYTPVSCVIWYVVVSHIYKSTFCILIAFRQFDCEAECHRRLLPFSGLSAVSAAWPPYLECQPAYLESQPAIYGCQSTLFM